MTAKKRKFWNIPPEEEQTGLLLWFQILQKHYLKLFGANAIAVLSLLPCAYFIYLLIQTGILWTSRTQTLCSPVWQGDASTKSASPTTQKTTSPVCIRR